MLTRAAALLLSLCSNACVSDGPVPPAAAFERFDTLVADFSTNWAALELPELELSFVANLDNLGDEAGLRRQRDTLVKLEDRLAAIDAQTLDVCRQIELSVMRTEVWLWQRRATLGLRQLGLDENYSTAASLTQLKLGRDWYAYLLDRWHGAELDPDELFAFGERELAAAVAAFDRVRVRLGFADTDALLQHIGSGSHRLAGGAPTRELFESRQARVWQHLGEQFLGNYGVEPADIARSERGADFPVPGYYDLAEGTFYYNILDDAGYEARQADWLFLHEATPGHHFQVSAARNSARCLQRLPEIFYSSYVEGWAAYVETLGGDLGLYEDAYSELAAIEWDMVRSVRVVLDVALNEYGWSDSQALAYWHDNVRGQRHVAEREIARMKRWPAQVITYKYGASVFERLRERYVHSANATMDVRQFHDAALSFGSMPLATFEAVLPALAGS